MTERLPATPEQQHANTRQYAAGNGGGYFGPRDAEHAETVLPGSSREAGIPFTPTPEQPPTLPVAQDVRPSPSDRHQSAIRLRRLRGPTLSSRLVPVQDAQQEPPDARRWSSSEPQRPAFPPGTAWSALPPVAEAPSHPYRGAVTPPALAALSHGSPAQEHHDIQFPRRRRRLTIQGQPLSQVQDRDCYDSRIVDFLDVIGAFNLLSFTKLLNDDSPSLIIQLTN
jgi:hypothetical protein